MLREFLLDSSIHGLRYLVLSRHPLAKLLWFCSICACMTSAAIVIYLNVANWRESPAVITEVSPDLAKGSPFMPMVTVCPLYPNLNNLLHGLLTRNPKYVRKNKLLERISELIIIKSVDKKVYQTKSIYVPTEEVGNQIFGHCMDSQNKSGSDCDFLFTLSGIGNVIKDLDRNFEFIPAFIAQCVANEVQPTLEELETFALDFYSIKISDEDRHYPENLNELERVMEMYNFFFPMFKDSNQVEIETLKSISDYVLPAVAMDKFVERDFALLLSYLIDFAVVERDEDFMIFVNQILIDLVKEYFNIPDIDYREVFRLVNSFSYKPLTLPFFGTSRTSYDMFCLKEKIKYVTSDNQTFSMLSLCQSNMELGETCRGYCQTLVTNETMQELMIGFYKMALDSNGPLMPLHSPHSLLPLCKFPPKPGERPKVEKDCWTKVITDRGICFAYLTGGSKREINGIGPNYAFKFALDRGGHFGNTLEASWDHLSGQRYEISVTPPEHFTYGRLEDPERMRYVYNARRSNNFLYKIKVGLDYVSLGTDEYRSMSPTKRKCLYPDEKQLLYFSIYSEPNCVLECAWQSALELCQCAPWFLRDHFPHLWTCEAHGNACFNEIVAGRYDLPMNGTCTKDCLPDCERVQFDTMEKNIQINPTEEDAAELGALRDQYTKEDKIANASPKEIIDIVNLIKHDNNHLGQFGLVQVFVDKKSTLRIVSTATVTAVDMVSNIGGTLGLFCGFSLLSAAEIVYWAAKWFSGRKNDLSSKKNRA